MLEGFLSPISLLYHIVAAFSAHYKKHVSVDAIELPFVINFCDWFFAHKGQFDEWTKYNSWKIVRNKDGKAELFYKALAQSEFWRPSVPEYNAGGVTRRTTAAEGVQLLLSTPLGQPELLVPNPDWDPSGTIRDSIRKLNMTTHVTQEDKDSWAEVLDPKRIYKQFDWKFPPIQSAITAQPVNVDDDANDIEHLKPDRVIATNHTVGQRTQEERAAKAQAAIRQLDRVPNFQIV